MYVWALSGFLRQASWQPQLCTVNISDIPFVDISASLVDSLIWAWGSFHLATHTHIHIVYTCTVCVASSKLVSLPDVAGQSFTVVCHKLRFLGTFHFQLHLLHYFTFRYNSSKDMRNFRHRNEDITFMALASSSLPGETKSVTIMITLSSHPTRTLARPWRGVSIPHPPTSPALPVPEHASSINSAYRQVAVASIDCCFDFYTHVTLMGVHMARCLPKRYPHICIYHTYTSLHICKFHSERAAVSIYLLLLQSLVTVSPVSSFLLLFPVEHFKISLFVFERWVVTRSQPSLPASVNEATESNRP